METTNAVGGGMSPVVGGEGNIKGYDPILISLVRRAAPNLIAYDICGVQPLTRPTGLIFAMKSRYQNQTGEALYNEARTSFSGNTGAEHSNNQSGAATALNANSGAGDPLLHEGITSAGGAGGAGGGTGNFGNQFGGATIGAEYGVNFGMSTTDAEQLGADSFQQMAFSIDRTSVVAKTRALKAEYTTELAQDLKAVHGLDAETELANILSNEILAEINREVVRTIYVNAKLGAQQV